MSWRRLDAEGCAWEVRVIAADPEHEARDAGGGEEILEFVAVDAIRPARRTRVPAGSLDDMDESALLAAYRQARPIGGDHYGRPGKRMPDAQG